MLADDDFTVLIWFKGQHEKIKTPVLKNLLYHFFTRKPYYKAMDLPTDYMGYSNKKEEILWLYH